MTCPALALTSQAGASPHTPTSHEVPGPWHLDPADLALRTQASLTRPSPVRTQSRLLSCPPPHPCSARPTRTAPLVSRFAHPPEVSTSSSRVTVFSAGRGVSFPLLWECVLRSVLGAGVPCQRHLSSQWDICHCPYPSSSRSFWAPSSVRCFPTHGPQRPLQEPRAHSVVRLRQDSVPHTYARLPAPGQGTAGMNTHLPREAQLSVYGPRRGGRPGGRGLSSAHVSSPEPCVRPSLGFAGPAVHTCAWQPPPTSASMCFRLSS